MTNVMCGVDAAHAESFNRPDGTGNVAGAFAGLPKVSRPDGTGNVAGAFAGHK